MLPDSIVKCALRDVALNASRILIETAVKVPFAPLLDVTARKVPALMSARAAGRRRSTRVLSVMMTVVVPAAVAIVAEFGVTDASDPATVTGVWALTAPAASAVKASIAASTLIRFGDIVRSSRFR